jgi:serine/threonine protein kinase
VPCLSSIREDFSRSTGFVQGQSIRCLSFAEIYVGDRARDRRHASGRDCAHWYVTAPRAYEAFSLTTVSAPDLSPSNILLEADDTAVAKVERAEIDEPSPRKVLADRTIHLSYSMPMTYGQAVITDFGVARLGGEGQKHTGDIMPGVFRAPEFIAGMEWDSKVDVWSVELLVCVCGSRKAARSVANASFVL